MIDRMDEKQFTDLAVKIEGIDKRLRSTEHRTDELESGMKEAKDMQITLVKLANGVENMGNQIMDVKEDIQDVKNGQNDLSNKVSDLENRPAQDVKKRWDQTLDKAAWLIIGGVLGYLLMRLFPGIPL